MTSEDSNLHKVFMKDETVQYLTADELNALDPELWHAQECPQPQSTPPSNKDLTRLTADEEDEQQAAKEASLIPKLTPEFLATLKEAVECVGWGVDMIETIYLTEQLYSLGGLPRPIFE